MAKVFSARRTGEILGLPHLEVIRRIRKGDIRAKKLDWNWIIPEDSIEEVRASQWYQKRLERIAARQNNDNAVAS